MSRRWLVLMLALFSGSAGCQEYDYVQHTKGDVFVQPDNQAKADVLFVVDDSASMSEEQDRLAGNFASFIAAIDATSADWHLGVVTTDVDASDAGVLRGGVFDPDTHDLDVAAVAALTVGVGGSRTEEGFGAAMMAVDGRNGSFLRSDARLNVVFFSDEDDQTPGTPDDFTSYLASLGSEVGFAVHGVVGDLPDGCASGTSAAEAGTRYVDAIDATEGWRESICADDYSDLLTRVGFEAAGLEDTFPLSKVPRTDTLSVLVDAIAMPQREVDGWTYSPGDNTVVFHGRAIPRVGMTIVINYVQLLGYDDPTQDPATGQQR